MQKGESKRCTMYSCDVEREMCAGHSEAHLCKVHTVHPSMLPMPNTKFTVQLVETNYHEVGMPQERRSGQATLVGA